MAAAMTYHNQNTHKIKRHYLKMRKKQRDTESHIKQESQIDIGSPSPPLQMAFSHSEQVLDWSSKDVAEWWESKLPDKVQTDIVREKIKQNSIRGVDVLNFNRDQLEKIGINDENMINHILEEVEYLKQRSIPIDVYGDVSVPEDDNDVNKNEIPDTVPNTIPAITRPRDINRPTPPT
eukprot:UN34027